MKVNNTPGVYGVYQQAGARKVTRSQEVSASAKSDGVVRSKEAAEFLALKDKVSQSPDIRRERIEDLRGQIEAGTYRPDAREIAGKMIRSRVLDDLV